MLHKTCPMVHKYMRVTVVARAWESQRETIVSWARRASGEMARRPPEKTLTCFNKDAVCACLTNATADVQTPLISLNG